MASSDVDGTHVPLADLGFQALQLFRQLVDAQPHPTKGCAGEEDSESFPVARFAAEFERFELWSVNLGLFVQGHGSLDYRVREAERLMQTIRRFMKELVDSLEEVVELRSGALSDDQKSGDHADNRLESDPEETSDTEGSDDSESDTEVLLDGVRDPIDRLYKISTKIRNPANRLGSSKGLNHKELDHETGVDLLSAVEPYDQDYIRSLFLQYQKDKSLQEHPVAEPQFRGEGKQGHDGDDYVWEPIRTVLATQDQSCFLIQRLARANMRRRRQFKYWKMHRDKLLRHTHASISAQSGPLLRGDSTRSQSQTTLEKHASEDSSGLFPLPTPSVTTATHLDMPRVEATTEQLSTVSVSEYAPSIWQPTRDAVTFPPPPKSGMDEKFFECPYCMTLCTRSTLTEKAWKAHVIRDLRPYVCTYEDCKNPDQPYDNRQDWIHHENSFHRKIWRCIDHSELSFAKLYEYRQHLKEEHNEVGDGELLNRIIMASESVLDAPDRPCPICSIVLATPRAIQGHIALHLERFALFALPRSVGNDDDEDELGCANSDLANGTNASSRNEDFDEGGLIFGSEIGDDDGTAADAPGWIVSTPKAKAELTMEAIRSLAANTSVEAEPIAPETPEPMASSLIKVTGATIMEFHDHDTPVYGAAFSANDKLLVSVSDDKVVRLWDVETGTSRESLTGHAKGFRSVAWSRDGKIIASGSYDKTIKLWDAATGACLRSLSGHGGAVSSLAFTSDTKLLVSSSHDKLAKVWNVESGALVFTLKGHTMGNFSITLSPDDRYVITGSNDRTAKIWDLSTGKLVHTLRGHGRVVYAAAVSPDSKILATGSNDWTIKLWGLESGTLLRTIKGHAKGVTALAFSPDTRLLASGSYDHTVRLWDTISWETVGTLEGHEADVYGVVFSRDGNRLASCSRDRTVRLWNLHVEDGTSFVANEAPGGGAEG